MQRSEAAQLVGMLVKAFPQSRADGETITVYSKMLEDLDYETAKIAVARLLTTAKFLPSIAEIRESCVAIERGPSRPGGEAWGDVQHAIRHVGGYGVPRFADPIVAEIVQRWGWRQLCWEGDGTADRARFVELYDQLARERRKDVVSGIPVSRRLEAAAVPQNVSKLLSGIGRSMGK